MKVKSIYFREITKKLTNFEIPTKGANNFVKNATQKENVKVFQITTFSDKFSLVESQDYCSLLLIVEIFGFWFSEIEN